MTNNPIVITGSARRQSHTITFVEFVFNGMEYSKIDLSDFNIAHYNYDNNYPDNDSFLKIIEVLLKHETIVFATPVYWYAMSGQMKVFFDRFTDLITINKHIGRQLKGKSIFLIAVGTDDKIPNGFEIPFKLTSDYLDMTYKSAVYFSLKHDLEHRKLLKNTFIKAILMRNTNDK